MQGTGEKNGLQQKIRVLEESIITISGPALATSGVIAGIDILTNNIIARYAPIIGEIMGVIWAVCLMLTLDFQVLVLGVRAHHIYHAHNKGKWQKAGEMLLICVIAGALAYVSLQMGSIFAKMIGTTMTIDQAAAELGINPIALIYERSAMVMLLIFMSGWLRDIEVTQDGQQRAPEKDINAPVPTPQPAPTATPSSQLILTPELVETLRALLAQTTVSEVPTPSLVALPAPSSTQGEQQGRTPEDENASGTTLDPLEKLCSGEQKEEENAGTEQTYANRIEALYKVNNTITVTEIVEQIGCSRSTAAKWLGRVKVAQPAREER